mmetsp:Transcript_11663/g.32478  ORF Transcript_11663/g.32478 Transcript_11663/m.32478 type:complete len:311 (-) Transcript_11663:1289-2221(-)
MKPRTPNVAALPSFCWMPSCSTGSPCPARESACAPLRLLNVLLAFFSVSSMMRLSLSILTAKSSPDFAPSVTSPNMPQALFQNPSEMDSGEKKATFSFLFSFSDTGRTRTAKCSPGACGSIRCWQAETHLPSMLTAQVLHSPFLHLYRMNTSACFATSLRGWPTRAIVMTFWGWKTTGVSPRSSWPGIIWGGSFSISSSRKGSSRTATASCASGLVMGSDPSRLLSTTGDTPDVSSISASSCFGSSGVLSSSRSICSRYFLLSSLGALRSATIFAPSPCLDASMRARSSSTPRTDVTASMSFRVGQGDLG